MDMITRLLLSSPLFIEHLFIHASSASGAGGAPPAPVVVLLLLLLLLLRQQGHLIGAAVHELVIIVVRRGGVRGMQPGAQELASHRGQVLSAQGLRQPHSEGGIRKGWARNKAQKRERGPYEGRKNITLLAGPALGEVTSRE